MKRDEPITPEDVAEAEEYAAQVYGLERSEVAGRIDDDGDGVTVSVRLRPPPTARVTITIEGPL